MGYIQGKSAIQIARRWGSRQRNFTGENFWARGFFVLTVGLDEAIIRAYIHHQEKEMNGMNNDACRCDSRLGRLMVLSRL
jgi:REP element-mobilizing transposase RayT